MTDDPVDEALQQVVARFPDWSPTPAMCGFARAVAAQALRNTRPQSDLTREGVAELREQIARVIDPSAWRVMDGYLAEMLRKYKGENAGYDPDQFKHKASLAKADAILAMVPGGGGWSIPQAVIDASERLRADAANTMHHSTTSDLSARLMCRVGVNHVALVLAWLDQHLPAAPTEADHG